MSRRILIVALAASAALIATQAHADRECFENSCRLPEVIEPPPPALPPVVEDTQAPADRIVHEIAAEPAAEPTAKPARQVVKAVAYREPVRHAPVAPKATRTQVREPVPVRAVAPPSEPPAARAVEPPPTRVVVAERAYASHRSSRGGALILNVPDGAYAPEAAGAVRPYILYTDNHAPRLYVLAPNAKIIQVDDGY